MMSRRGRPTKYEQVEMQKKLWPYFESNLSARFTSRIHGMPNEKTIQKIFHKWQKELTENLAITFKQKTSDVISKSLLIHDQQIYNLSVLNNDLMESHRDAKKYHEEENQRLILSGSKPLKSFKPDLHLIKTIIQLNKVIFQLKDYKQSFEIRQFTPQTERQIEAEIAYDNHELESYKKEIEEMIRNTKWARPMPRNAESN